ncbi:hypothetical protein O9929_12515 [Vibrio lentus]|nr:hypothetical protein [Vibrio lentus]
MGNGSFYCNGVYSVTAGNLEVGDYGFKFCRCGSRKTPNFGCDSVVNLLMVQSTWSTDGNCQLNVAEAGSYTFL